jgi:hypothetical protein
VYHYVCRRDPKNENTNRSAVKTKDYALNCKADEMLVYEPNGPREILKSNFRAKFGMDKTCKANQRDSGYYGAACEA